MLAVSVLIAVLLMVVAGTGGAAAQMSEAPDCSTVEYDGEGTEADPYEVEDVDQLQCIGACHRKILTKGSRVWKVCPAQPCRV